MSRHAPFLGVPILIALAVVVGCQPQQPFYFKHVDDELAHYKGVATEIEYPDLESERSAEVDGAKRPFSLQNMDTKEIWDLTLEEAVQIALTNNKVMRNIGGQVQGPPDFLLRNPELVPSIYDPALSESNPRTGAEAALSAFDTQLSTSMVWEKFDTPQNVQSGFDIIFPNVRQDDLGTFQARLQKITATGGTFALTHNVKYDLSNQPTREYAADWNINLVAEARQPLLRGAGVQFNRINGPGTTLGPGNYNGVMIARINTDIALADFEAAVRNLVSDVEKAYWELYFNYRSLDAVIAGRDSALSTWRKIYTLYRIGGRGGEAEKEAQAREQYFLFRSTAEQSLNLLYSTESKLRYLLGLAATDGRLIRPKNEPTVAKVSFDWYDVQAEALARSVELREQKWIVKRRELELIAAKNYLLPQLDAVAQYRWLGLGNDLLATPGGTGGDFSQPGSNAYQSMTNGAFQEWQMGFQFNMPLGFRREMAGVRNAQLSLVRERVKLQEGELELSHQLAYAIRDLETNYVLSQTNLNRRVAAQRQVEAVAAAYETDTVTLDVLLQAQRGLAQAESDFFRSVVNYNESISQVHYRKGSLLEYNGVYLTEGPWPGKAYFDARRRARERAASTYLDYGFTQPRVISRGPYEQNAAGGEIFDGGELDGATAPSPTPATPSEPGKEELVPTPQPEPPEPAAEPRAATPTGKRNSTDTWTRIATKPRNSGSLPGGEIGGGSVDGQVTPAGWTTTGESGKHEYRADPSPPATDRPATGWKGIQH